MKILTKHAMVLLLALVLAATAASAASKEPTRSYGSIDVTLYTTSWCPYCTKARNDLQEMGVNLTEYDIEKDPARHAEMMEKTGGRRGVPVIDVEGIILPGYSAEAIRSAVDRQRRK